MHALLSRPYIKFTGTTVVHLLGHLVHFGYLNRSCPTCFLLSHSLYVMVMNKEFTLVNSGFVTAILLSFLYLLNIYFLWEGREDFNRFWITKWHNSSNQFLKYWLISLFIMKYYNKVFIYNEVCIYSIKLVIIPSIHCFIEN